jgi:Bacterial surface proteins containing Ig-like domains
MKKIFYVICLCLLILTLRVAVEAHSGRTDSYGGHNDNKNVSGLGSYHYHHGYGPHLHDGGICPYSPKDKISVDNMPTTMKIGDKVELLWTVTYYSGSNMVMWSSSDVNILEAKDGTLTAKGEGNVSVTASMYNGSRTFSVQVRPIYAESLTINNSPELLEVGTSISLMAVIEPSNATNKKIEWLSSNGQPPEVYTEIELGLALIQADQSADCGAGGR